MIHLDSTGKPTPPVIDQSDTEDISDIDDNSLDGERDHNENAICGECTILYGYVVTLTRTTGSECKKESPRALGNLFQRVGQVLIFFKSVTVPDPYPLNLPDGVELPECWYVVDRGTEVGIFAEK